MMVYSYDFQKDPHQTTGGKLPYRVLLLKNVVVQKLKDAGWKVNPPCLNMFDCDFPLSVYRRIGYNCLVDVGYKGGNLAVAASTLEWRKDAPWRMFYGDDPNEVVEKAVEFVVDQDP